MFALRRTVALTFSNRGVHGIFNQSRSITTISTSLRVNTRSTILPLLQKRFVSDVSKENDQGESLVEDSVAPDSLAPDTTSAAQFDASDIEPIEAREIPQEVQPESQESAPQEVQPESQESAPQDIFNSDSRESRVSERTQNNTISKQLYLGNLYFDVSEEDLRKEFSRFGSVTNLKIIKDARGMSKGFGYITFEEQEAATTARDTMDRQTYEGRRLNVQYSEPRALNQVFRERKNLREFTPKQPSRTLYIGNMSFELTDQDLSKLFSTIKNVLDVRVAIDRRTGQPRGFAHADFTDIESAEAGFQKLNGKEVYGRTLRCDYSGPSSRTRQRGLE